MCMRHTAQFDSRTASKAPAACKAWTSLMQSAPIASAARMTSGRRVSTEIGTPSGTKASSTGLSRRNSRAGSTGSAPGRVDSAPMSMRSAPSAIIRWACSTARSGLAYWPPSENESGVTFRIPITSGRSRLSRNRPHSRNDAKQTAPDDP